jgi:esterase
MVERIAALGGGVLIAFTGALVSGGATTTPHAPHHRLQQAIPATPYEDRFVTVNGLRLHYQDWGTAGKQPFIMLHGIARTSHTFDHIAPRFTQDYHVLAIDLRGHGDSAWHPAGAYLVEDYVKDLEGIVAELGLRNVVITGNSTGGRVAQVYAGVHPENVAAVIVEDVGPERPNEIAANFAKRVAQEANGWASADELLASVMKGGGSVSEPLQRTHVRYGSHVRPDGRVVWKRDPNLVKGFVPTELWQYVSKITAPVLYVLGGDSTIVPAETQERLKKTLPRCEVVVMPGLGHYPHLENPEAFLSVVTSFLSKLRSSARQGEIVVDGPSVQAGGTPNNWPPRDPALLPQT